MQPNHEWVTAPQAWAEFVARQGGELLREGHHRLMGEAGQHDVVERVELLVERRLDARMAVAEQVGPPGADGIQIAVAVEILQPGAFAAADGHQRQGLVQLHLGARMPDGVEAAAEEIVVVHLEQVA